MMKVRHAQRRGRSFGPAMRLLSNVDMSRVRGGFTLLVGALLVADLTTYRASDPSFDTAAYGSPNNILGSVGADVADVTLQSIGLAAWVISAIVMASGLAALTRQAGASSPGRPKLRLAAACLSVAATSIALAAAPPPTSWPLAAGLGGMAGDSVLSVIMAPLTFASANGMRTILGAVFATAGLLAMAFSLGVNGPRVGKAEAVKPVGTPGIRASAARAKDPEKRSTTAAPPVELDEASTDERLSAPIGAGLEIKKPKTSVRASGREERETQPTLPFGEPGFRLPELIMLTKPKPRASAFDEGALRQSAQMLETVLAEFGVRGQIDHIRPGPVVTLYELVPAPGVKSARVVALSDDIARSMSVAACRVSVVPGRNAIGIELPNPRRETVYLRDMLSSAEYEKASQALPLALGETIGGEPYIVDLAKMPHLLIAGTTGSGKSVGVNAMILSILYRLPPEKCRFIMIDPKMLELSVYDGIPHLLAPVVTDPKKAIVALKWTVREMEDRYRRMSKIGVRNVAGYNERANEALAKGEHFVRTVQTGFDDQGRPIFEEEKLRPEPMPFLVVVIDEVADLMMVAGKDIEGAVQRLAQMARAAGIHLIMATQRPSVDVITGTIKANFPTRISFQVTSKIDSRTIMGEQGAEQLLGMGDMLYMAGGGRITRLHGPYVDDEEVIKVAKFLRDQGEPQYLEDVTALPDEDGDGEASSGDEGAGGNNLYDQAVAVVTRDRKASTSYIQRRLQIGYNRAASLIERMEKEGVVSAANHAGKREILVGPPP